MAEGVCKVREAARLLLTERATGKVSAYRVVLAGGDKRPGQAHLIEVNGDTEMLTGDLGFHTGVDSSDQVPTSEGVQPSSLEQAEAMCSTNRQAGSCQVAVAGRCCVAWANDGRLRCFDGESSTNAKLPAGTGSLVSVTVRPDLPLLVRLSSIGAVDVYLAGTGEEDEPASST